MCVEWTFLGRMRSKGIERCLHSLRPRHALGVALIRNLLHCIALQGADPLACFGLFCPFWAGRKVGANEAQIPAKRRKYPQSGANPKSASFGNRVFRNFGVENGLFENGCHKVRNKRKKHLTPTAFLASNLCAAWRAGFIRLRRF